MDRNIHPQDAKILKSGIDQQLSQDTFLGVMAPNFGQHHLNERKPLPHAYLPLT